MQKIELDLISTLLVSIAVFFLGRALVARVPLLKRFSIPAPVVGGGLMAVLLALLTGVFGTAVSFNMSLKDSLLLMFFTTVGLSADVRMLARGGPQLLLFLGISVAFIVVQNLIGLVGAMVMDLHPVVGLLAGSMTLTGGHGTGAAYAGRLGETMNLQGAMELTMAAATGGLVIGAVIGGPLAEYLIKRFGLQGPEVAAADAEAVAAAADEITAPSLIGTLFWILLCLAGGRVLVALMAETGFILPDFVFCLLLGVADSKLRHADRRAHNERGQHRHAGQRGVVTVPRHGAHDDEAAGPGEPGRSSSRHPRRSDRCDGVVRRPRHVPADGA